MLIENRKPKDIEVERVTDDSNMWYRAIYNNRTFTFPVSLYVLSLTTSKVHLINERVEVTQSYLLHSVTYWFMV